MIPERKSDILPSLKALCWCSHLEDLIRGPQGGMPVSPTLNLAHAWLGPCHTYLRFQLSELLLASKGSRLLHQPPLLEMPFPLSACLSPAHSCLSFQTQLNITTSGKPPLEPNPLPSSVRAQLGLGADESVAWSSGSWAVSSLSAGAASVLFGIFGTWYSAGTAGVWSVSVSRGTFWSCVLLFLRCVILGESLNLLMF